MPKLQIKRVYDAVDTGDGFRVLVDRLWPRGLSKEKAHIDLWLKELAPSNELRTWFHHETEKWPEFQKKYEEELSNNLESLNEFKRVIKDHNTVTLLYGAKDTLHNNAVVLQHLLQ